MRLKFQMKARTLSRPCKPCASPGVNALTITRQLQTNLGRSIQRTRVARGSRRSNVATAKLPSLTQYSPACILSIRTRNAGTSSFPQCDCQVSSRQITGAPIIPPSCRANVVFPVPAQPRMTIRSTVKIITTKDAKSHKGCCSFVNLSVLRGLCFLAIRAKELFALVGFVFIFVDLNSQRFQEL